MSSTLPAYFGQGTKLTVLGKYFTLPLSFVDVYRLGVTISIKKKVKLDKIILVEKDRSVSRSVFLHCDNAEAYFGKGTKLTVLGKSTVTGNVVQVAG